MQRNNIYECSSLKDVLKSAWNMEYDTKFVGNWIVQFLGMQFGENHIKDQTSSYFSHSNAVFRMPSSPIFHTGQEKCHWRVKQILDYNTKNKLEIWT